MSLIYLTPQNVAERLGISPGTLAKWRCLSMDGPRFTKIGTRVRYGADDLAAWLEARSRRSTSEVGTPGSSGRAA